MSCRKLTNKRSEHWTVTDNKILEEIITDRNGRKIGKILQEEVKNTKDKEAAWIEITKTFQQESGRNGVANDMLGQGDFDPRKTLIQVRFYSNETVVHVNFVSRIHLYCYCSKDKKHKLHLN